MMRAYLTADRSIRVPIAPARDGFRRWLLITWILAMPITQVIYFGGKRANVAASDLFIPLGVAFLIWQATKGQLRVPLFALCCLSVLAIDLSILANLEDVLASKGAAGAIVEMVKILSLWLQFYVMVNLISSRESFRIAVRTWVMGSVLISLIGIYGSLSYQMTGVQNDYALQFRAQSTMGDSNLFAGYLAVSLMLAFLLWQFDRAAHKWIPVAIMIQLGGIFLSASRGTMLSLTAMLSLLAILSMTWKARAVATVFVVAVVGCISAIPGFNDVLAASPYTERLATVTVNLNDEHASDRKALWQDALVRFEGSPFFGVGRANFRPLDAQGFAETGQVHNMFLGIACETGLFGAFVYALIFSFHTVAFGMDRISIGRRFPLTTRLMLCSLLLLLMCGFTISLENFRGLWVLLGLMETYRLYLGAYGSDAVEATRV